MYCTNKISPTSLETAYSTNSHFVNLSNWENQFLISSFKTGFVDQSEVQFQPNEIKLSWNPPLGTINKILLLNYWIQFSGMQLHRNSGFVTIKSNMEIQHKGSYKYSIILLFFIKNTSKVNIVHDELPFSTNTHPQYSCQFSSCRVNLKIC